MMEMLDKETTFQMVVRPSKQKSQKCVRYQIKDETQANIMVPRATLFGGFYM
jgi:hypothetical protein